MRRAGRYILNCLTGLSLLLCVGTAYLWLRSYWVADTWAASTGHRQAGRTWWVTIRSTHGRLAVEATLPPGRPPTAGHEVYPAQRMLPSDLTFSTFSDPGVRGHFEAAGVWWCSTDGGWHKVFQFRLDPSRSLSLPHWMP